MILWQSVNVSDSVMEEKMYARLKTTGDIY